MKEYTIICGTMIAMFDDCFDCMDFVWGNDLTDFILNEFDGNNTDYTSHYDFSENLNIECFVTERMNFRFGT